jgi:anti-sigma28 factor (negative regulator of flagellin synthesis)
MNNTGHLPVSESAARRVRNSKGKQKKHAKSKTAGATQVSGQREMAAAGSLTRTKALLLAALRVWELKHRIRD